LSLSSIPNIDLDDRLELAGTTNPGFTIIIAVVGILKGFDALQNLVLDDVKEEGTGKFQNRVGSGRVDQLTDWLIASPRIMMAILQTVGLPGRSDWSYYEDLRSL
jgi:small nuclear ribonucleoprotein (snRNP)-like protein